MGKKDLLKFILILNVIIIVVSVFLILKLMGNKNVCIEDKIVKESVIYESGKNESGNIIINIENNKSVKIEFIGRSNESEGDDSVSPEFKNIIKLEREIGGDWKIVEQKDLWKCQEGRGHQDFSDELCV